MVSLLFLACLPLLASAVCDGYFSQDPNDNNICKFRCYDDTYETIASMTFNEIRDNCDTVLDGFRFNSAECSDKDDLVWDDGCDCPYCKCATEDTEGTYQSWTQLISKRCKKCTCTSHPWDTSITDNVYQCDTESSVSDPYNWDDFQCPGTPCTDVVSGSKYYPAQAIFGSVDVVDAECNKFCYCKPGGVPECKTGFANILDSGSDELKSAFWDHCEYEVQACTDAPSRMFTEDKGPSCSSYACPKCDCGSHSEGAVWWHPYQSQDGGFGTYTDATTCSRCTCQKDGNGKLYAQCDSDSTPYPNSGSGYSCPGSTTIKCHEEYGYGDCSGSGCVVELKTKGVLNSVETKNNMPEAWCSNTYQIEIESNDDDDVWWDWGNDGSPFCAIYGTNEECYWYRYSVTYTDCYGDTQTEASTEYEYCCNSGDNCNHIDINMNKDVCSENTRLSALLQTLWECMYSGNGRSGWIGGDCDKLEEEIVSCTSIKNLYEDQANCLCKAYKNLYDDANPDWQLWIKDIIDMFMTSFTEWNDVLNCPGRLECNLDADDPEVAFIPAKANGKLYIVSLLCTLIMGFIMFN